MQNTEMHKNPLTLNKNRSILKMLGRPNGGLLFYFPKKRIKKRPLARTYINEMTLELLHLSPTVKQGSFLFYFSI